MRISIIPAILVASAIALCSTVGVRADVTGAGDVSPVGPVDLPIEGGDISEVVIVGGAGVDPYEVGVLTIDLGFITDPLGSPGGIIGNTPTSIGQAFVTGLFSEWQIIDGVLSIGYAGTGTLEVSNRARVSTFPEMFGGEDDVFIGELEFSYGELRVTGFATRFENTDMTVGNLGVGRMVVESEGRATSSNVLIGREDEGIGYVEVSGRGTQWHVSEDVTVGVEGRGYVEIFDEATARSETAKIGDDPGSYGEVRVSDYGTLWELIDTLDVGSTTNPSAQGILWISNDALVRVRDDEATGSATAIARGGRLEMRGGTLVSSGAANAGLIRGYGRLETRLTNTEEGEIRNAADVANLRERLLFTGTVANDGLVESIGGEMEFESAVSNSLTGKIVGSNGIYRFGTTLDRSVTHLENDGQLALTAGVNDIHGRVHNAVDGEIVVAQNTHVTFYDEVDNDGTLAIGPGGTALFLDVPGFASTSNLLLNLSSAITDGAPPVRVAGDVTLDGTLGISLASGFIPEIGQSYMLLAAESVSSVFATEQLPVLPGVDLDIAYTPTSVLLNATAGGGFFNADFNLDGTVNGPDLLIWQMGYQNGTTHAEGDANGDGAVDATDRSIWEFQFGGPPSSAVGVAVPEPGAIGLALSGIAIGLAAGRKRRSLRRQR